MVKLVRVATCNLDQWAMEFDTNLEHIISSIKQAKAAGCTFRTGPELEVTGYGCYDHFLEQDTILHAWQSVAALLQGDLTDGIIVDVGVPVLHHSVRYNCRVLMLNRKILLVRPKMCLANDGNYRETRWFTAWTKTDALEEHVLPADIQQLTGQRSVPFGVAIVECADTTLTVETCEELFTPDSPHIWLGLNGAEIIANGSGSHHQLRKLDTRLNLMKSATAKGGGAYLYANQQGCDGDRLYFDGCACAVVNGDVVAQGKQFSVYDVEMVYATIDLDDIRSYRAVNASRSVQAASAKACPRVRVDFRLGMTDAQNAKHMASNPVQVRFHTPQEEIAYGPACWLWDYLRRSGAGGFFLPLSGGADSAATAAIVGIMCRLVVTACSEGDGAVIADARRIAGELPESKYTPADPKEFCSRILHTMYMGTKNSSEETRKRASDLALELGAYHMDASIDGAVDAMLGVFAHLTGGKTPRYKVHGGTDTENLALQNLQARLRMVLAYLSAQLLPWHRHRKGYLLVLGSANVDEALRGYMTKYDCSAADLNPIGGIAKGDLKSFLVWASGAMKWKTLADIVAAPPTAELEPITATHKQTDEEDMGMSYADLALYGQLRKIARCGPVAMYQKLLGVWPTLPAREVYAKVRRFFYYYAANRHKATVLTPSYHAESYSPDDNRFDLRQFLYHTQWPRQFRHIETLVANAEKDAAAAIVNGAPAVAAAASAAAATAGDAKAGALAAALNAAGGVAVLNGHANGAAAAPAPAAAAAVVTADVKDQKSALPAIPAAAAAAVAAAAARVDSAAATATPTRAQQSPRGSQTARSNASSTGSGTGLSTLQQFGTGQIVGALNGQPAVSAAVAAAAAGGASPVMTSRQQQSAKRAVAPAPGAGVAAAAGAGAGASPIIKGRPSPSPPTAKRASKPAS